MNNHQSHIQAFDQELFACQKPDRYVYPRFAAKSCVIPHRHHKQEFEQRTKGDSPASSKLVLQTGLGEEIVNLTCTNADFIARSIFVPYDKRGNPHRRDYRATTPNLWDSKAASTWTPLASRDPSRGIIGDPAYLADLADPHCPTGGGAAIVPTVPTMPTVPTTTTATPLASPNPWKGGSAPGSAPSTGQQSTGKPVWECSWGKTVDNICQYIVCGSSPASPEVIERMKIDEFIHREEAIIGGDSDTPLEWIAYNVPVYAEYPKGKGDADIIADGQPTTSGGVCGTINLLATRWQTDKDKKLLVYTYIISPSSKMKMTAFEYGNTPSSGNGKFGHWDNSDANRSSLKACLCAHMLENGYKIKHPRLDNRAHAIKVSLARFVNFYKDDKRPAPAAVNAPLHEQLFADGVHDLLGTTPAPPAPPAATSRRGGRPGRTGQRNVAAEAVSGASSSRSATGCSYQKPGVPQRNHWRSSR